MEDVKVYDNVVRDSAATGAVQDVGSTAIFRTRDNTFVGNTYSGGRWAWENSFFSDLARWQTYHPGDGF